MKVLVVDPDVGRRPLLRAALTAGGAEIAEAPNGSFALTMLEWNRQDVILSRARIEDMDGVELCSILRADPNAHGVRFALLAEQGEVAPSAAAAAGVDLIIPASTAGGAVLQMLVELVQRAAPPPVGSPPPEAVPQAPEVAVAPVSVPAPIATTPPPVAPRPARPPVVTMPKPIAIRPAASPSGAPMAPAARTGAPASPIAPITPAPGTPPRARVAPVAPAPVTPSSPGASAPSGSATPPGTSARAAAPPAGPVAPAPSAAKPTSAAVAVDIPARTFQGALGVMEMEELVQAISTGGKTGRLLLVLGRGGGMIAFEKGRVIHAEFGAVTGTAAFEALVTASHREGTGKFCFIPGDAAALASMPRTISVSVDSLLLSIATAMDEGR